MSKPLAAKGVGACLKHVSTPGFGLVPPRPKRGGTARADAEAIGQGRGLPVRSVALDDERCFAVRRTRDDRLERLNARTAGAGADGPDLLADLAAMDYSAIAQALSTSVASRLAKTASNRSSLGAVSIASHFATPNRPS